MTEPLKLLQTAQLWLQNGETVYLFHVAQTWGSSPRPPGSLMAVNGSGQHTGSVSGGCVESDLFQRISAGEFQQQQIMLLEYSNESQPQITLPCRGQMQIVLEVLHDVETLQPIIEAIESRQSLTREIHIIQAQIHFHQQRRYHARFENNVLTEPYGAGWRVLLIGANDLAQHVASQCQVLGYEVIIADPRESYRQNWQLADCELTALMPDEAVEKYVTDEYSAVLALTHDPKLDDLAIIQALDGPAFYLGALGSKRSAVRRKETFRKMNIPVAQIDKLDAPIGLNIGSRTPAEIAVAIAAKLIQVRNRIDVAQPASLHQA